MKPDFQFLLKGPTHVTPIGGITPGGESEEDAQVYPQGETRKRINGYIKKFLATLKEEKALEKSLRLLDLQKGLVPVIPLELPEPAFGQARIKAAEGDLEPAKLAKFSLPRCSLKIWLVDGQLIRDCAEVDFIGAGHHYRWAWIPEDEIWIEATVTSDEQKLFLAHELAERALMARGMGYDKAHDQATKREKDAREHPGVVEQAIMTGIIENSRVA